MPIVLTETPESPQVTTGDNPSADVLYKLSGTSDEPTARAYVAANTPTTYDGFLVRQSIALDPVWVNETGAVGLWDITVRYGTYESDPPPATGESSFSFDTGGGTQHITQSKATIVSKAISFDLGPDAMTFASAANRITQNSGKGGFAGLVVNDSITVSGTANNNRNYTIGAIDPAGDWVETAQGLNDENAANAVVVRSLGTAPNHRGAIGVTHDNVEGVDITMPVYNFSEMHYIADSVVTPSYKANIARLTGRVNDASFKGFAAGEVLFLGASGSKRGADDWEISFRFAQSENETNLPVGSMTGIDKKGWEYIWVRYADAEDAGGTALVKRPAAVYVERVYDSGDFSWLGIGT